MTESIRVMQNVVKQKSYLEHRTTEIEVLGSVVAADLETLRRRVRQAREAAADIAISVTSDWSSEEGCVRSYRANLSSTLSNEVELVYAVDTEDARDGLLLYLPSTSLTGEARNFMALEMVDRKIRYERNSIFIAMAISSSPINNNNNNNSNNITTTPKSLFAQFRMLWNNGAGTQAIMSNVTLETARDLRTEDHKWYVITAQR